MFSLHGTDAVTINSSKENMIDRLGRPLRDLRISLTDQCNFRCQYCMPADRKYNFFKEDEKLSRAEIARLASIFVGLGVERIRLTGGEPLLRRDIVDIVEDLQKLDVKDIPLTTNGEFLAEKAEGLKKAGVSRITISLDSLDEKNFAKMSGNRGSLKKVIAGIDRALEVGLGPIKINCVLKKGENEESIFPLVDFARERKITLRFIEFMDVGNQNKWDHAKVVSSKDLQAQIADVYPLETCEKDFYGEVAERYRYLDGGGEVGFISSVTQPFCGSCTRARLSSDGKLYNCLFSFKGLDLREALRNGSSDEELNFLISNFWQNRTNRYSEERVESNSSKSRHDIVEMFQIGG